MLHFDILIIGNVKLKQNFKMFKYIIILMFVINIVLGQDVNFCSKQYTCRFNGKSIVNSICEINHNCGIGPNCANFERILLTQTEKKALLDKNNGLRNMHALGNGLISKDHQKYPFAANMRELVWDEELEFQAQCWANQCPTKEAACVVKADTTIGGQNIAWSLTNDILNMTQKFYDEGAFAKASIVDQNFTEMEISMTRHFVQLIWANATNIGCGRSKYYNNKTNEFTYCLVCNYATKGNVEESKMYITGPPCTKCPDSTQCHPTYTGLCSTKPSISKAYDYCKYSVNRQNCKSPFAILEEVENSITRQLQEINTVARNQSEELETNNTRRKYNFRVFRIKRIRQGLEKAIANYFIILLLVLLNIFEIMPFL